MYRQSKAYGQNSSQGGIMGKNNRITPVMFVSKTEDVSADYYIESEAEEIYVPDTHVNKNRG
jgi:hypothetical protein